MTTQAKLQPTISCVIPAYNEAGNLGRVMPDIIEKISNLAPRFEIILVNDGSQDNTCDVAAELVAAYPEIVLIDLSRNFGKEAAMTAGLEHAKGDVVFIMDADGQHPTSLLPKMFQKWQEGIEVVFAVRNTREDQSSLYTTLVGFFYTLINLGGRFEIPRNAGDFRLMDRKVVDALLSLQESNRFMKGLYAWVGFSSYAIGYEPSLRLEGKSKYGVLGGIKLALTGMLAFSTAPLRLLTVSGLLLSISAMVYVFWIVFEHFYWGMTVPGYATLIVSIVFFSGIQLLALGILSAYIARIYEEVKRRPLYLVRKQTGQGLN
jgi:polyisoprenyl-phosphate glycosyltransferase